MMKILIEKFLNDQYKKSNHRKRLFFLYGFLNVLCQAILPQFLFYYSSKVLENYVPVSGFVNLIFALFCIVFYIAWLLYVNSIVFNVKDFIRNIDWEETDYERK